MKIFTNTGHPQRDADISHFSLDKAKSIRHFHSGITGYEPTPLYTLDNLAAECGLGGIFVKDESFRFDLASFKVLGSSYAVARYIAEQSEIDKNAISFEMLLSPELRRKTGDMTLITATDGNHGRGVAWTANKLKQHSVVYMPRGSAKRRLDNILSLGADASITVLNYDATVAFAAEQARKNGWVLIQDTAWEGYETIPLWIMQGYMTMALEAFEQLRLQDEKPTHIILQAGVGSMAAAVAAFFKNVFGDECPKIIVIEPNAADCFYRSAVAGKPVQVEGDMNTLMAGLACGKPSAIAWTILNAYADAFISCSDDITVSGMEILASPHGADPRILSGESGAVGAGLLAELNGEHGELLREGLKLNSMSRVLLFSTEGLINNL